MRKASSAVFLSFIFGFVCACDFGSPGPRSPSPSPRGPASPELIQYAEDISRSWELRNAAINWRSEIDDVRDGRPVHITSEAICPDRYHIIEKGSDPTEYFYIGKMTYQKKGPAAWTLKKMPMPYPSIPFCRKGALPRVDDGRIRLVAEQLRGITLSKPAIREIAGRQCREWTRTFTNGKRVFVNTNCFELQTHELVQSRIGNKVSTYYWNIPLQINAPQ